jgi:Putative SAM-dependent methyltransferase
MTLFELVKVTLDELYKEAIKQYGGQADAEIKAKFAYLSDSYGKLSDPARAPISYKDPATRFAYVYRYVASHGDYVVQLLKRAASALGGSVFPKGTARVSCIGGGPGSDILAILKYLDDYKAQESVNKLVVYLLDKEQAWADTWTELDDKLDAGVKLNTNFQQLDVLKPDWTSQRKFLDADVFTLSYFASEVYSLDGKGEVSEFWQTLFEEAKPGALFCYDDNGTDDFNAYFDGQWQKAGLTQIDAGSNVSWTPRYTERADVLDGYKAKFSAWPKLKGYLSYRVIQKPK